LPRSGRDLRDSIAVEQKFDQALDPALTAFKAARERGETPPPVFLRISGSDTPPRSPCLGVLQAQIAELMDPTLLWEICFYYERDGTAQKYVRYAVFTENEVLPRLKEDSRVFYTADRNASPRRSTRIWTGCRNGAGTSRPCTSGGAVSMTGCASHRSLDHPADPLLEERSTSVGGSGAGADLRRIARRDLAAQGNAIKVGP
jgi:hypothetical protein